MRAFLACITAMCAFAASACASLPSVNDEGVSPRRTTIAAAETTISVFDKLTVLAAAGALPKNFADDVGQYAGDARSIATGYLDATAACVVIDGQLQSDPATGAACQKSNVLRAFGDVSTLISEAVQRVGPGSDTGRVLLVASLLLDRQLRPSPGDVWSGYEKREDVTLEEFNQVRGALAASFDRFVAAAAGKPAAVKGQPR